MTRADAARIIERIRADEIRLHLSPHARQRLRTRHYSPHDVRTILKRHEIETAPAWSEQHQNFKVLLLGKCLEGRPTRLVLGLRENGPCVLVTIMIARDVPRMGKSK